MEIKRLDAFCVTPNCEVLTQERVRTPSDNHWDSERSPFNYIVMHVLSEMLNRNFDQFLFKCGCGLMRNEKGRGGDRLD